MSDAINKSVKKPIKQDKRVKAQEGLLDSLAEFDNIEDDSWLGKWQNEEDMVDIL